MENVKFVFTGIIVQEKGGYTSLCTDLDVASQGKSPLEAKKNLEEAVSVYLETALENNLPILRPVSVAENPGMTRKESIVETFRVDVALGLQVHA